MAAEAGIQPWSATEYGNLALVQEIKKHPCLYNNTIPEYSRKDITAKAWQEIADKFECSVARVKLRWKNLRTAYCRGKRAQWKGGIKNQKPYYMDKYMSFLLPFTKSRMLMQQLANHCYEKDPPDSEQADDAVEGTPKRVKPTLVKIVGATVHTEDATENCFLPENSFLPAAPDNHSRPPPVVAQPDILKDVPAFSISDSESFRTQFMMSILPEIEEMTESKFRTFKRNILSLIDDIKNEE